MNIAYLPMIDIRKKADIFRDRHEQSEIPIDIEKIVEKNLKIKIVPVPGLIKIASIDALITSDWSTILVDENFYFNFETRFRFSLAHEIAHFVLHKKIYESFDIQGQEDFKEVLEKIPGKEYGFLEYQANCFASFLLIPVNVLTLEIKNIVSSDKIYQDFFETDKAKIHYLTLSLYNKFNVSKEAMRIAVENFFKYEHRNIDFSL